MGGKHVGFVLMVAGVILGGAAVLAPPQVTRGDAAPAPTPVAIHGSFPGAVSKVVLYAQQEDKATRPGASSPMAPVTAASVTIDGADFTIRVDPANIEPRYFHDGGVVDFQVFGQGAKQTWTTVASARAAKVDGSGDAVWVDPVTSEPLIGVTPSARRDRSIGAGTRSGLDRRGVPALSLGQGKRQLISMGAATAARTTGFAAAPTAVPMGVCNRYWTGASTVRSTTIGTTYPVGQSTAWMDISSSLGGEYGVAFKYAAGGGFETTGAMFKRSGWGFTWAPSGKGVSRSYRKGIEYRYFQVACAGAIFGYEWRPYAETGGVGSVTGIDRPSWNTRCIPLDKGRWYRQDEDGKAYTLGTGVKFASKIGMDLSVKRQYSRSQRAVYNIALGRPKKMCGNDGFPSRSGKQIERYR